MTTVKRQQLKYILSDFLMLEVGWFVFNVVRYLSLPGLSEVSFLSFYLDPVVQWGQIVVPAGMIGLYALSGTYNRSGTLYRSRLEEMFNTVVVSFVGMLGIFFAVLINDDIPERLDNYEILGVLFLCLALPAGLSRYWITTRTARKIKRGLYVVNTLVIGASADNESRLRRISRSSVRSGLRLAGCVDVDEACPGDSIAGLPVLRGRSVGELCSELGIGALVVLPSPQGVGRTAELIDNMYRHGLPIFVPADLYDLMAFRPRFSAVVSEPLVDITNANIPPSVANMKRASDAFLAGLALVALSPLMALIALAVRLDSPGPVLYRQVRVGRHKRLFKVNKFRSMCVDAEPDGPVLSRPGDPRITRLGRVLRKYRLDELPQLWNVFVGDMSLVGPRPEREFFVEQILARRPSHTLIHQVRPGLTSWAVVKCGYACNIDEMIERSAYDLLYIENVSLGVDLKILFYTVNTIVTGKGI